MALKFECPPEFKDPAKRAEAAQFLCQLVDVYFSDPTRSVHFDRYSLAQDVFDDKQVLSNIEIQNDIEPYGVPLIRKHVKGAVRMVAGGFNGADPYYIAKGDGDTDLREAREQDTHLALKADGYTSRLRDSARDAAIWHRGPYMLEWETKTKDSSWASSDESKDAELEFAGPRRIPIPPKDFIIMPLLMPRMAIPDVRMVGHRTDRPMYEIWEMQERGEYFGKDEAAVSAQHDQPTAVLHEEDFQPDLYSLTVKLPPGMDKSKPLRAYQVTVVKGQQIMLFIERFTLPYPMYFAPGFEYDPLEFWGTHSLASSMFESQTIVNDTTTTRILNGVGRTKKTVLASGMVGEMTTYPLSQGDLTMFRGDPKFTVVETNGEDGGDLAALGEEARRDAEGVTGFSEVAAGQLPEASQTATATGGALQATADEGEEKRQNFFAEEIRYVQGCQMLIRRNFKPFKRHHGDKLKTKRASDWDVHFEFAPNGQGPQNNPELTIRKLDSFVEFLTEKLGIPFVEDLPMGTPPPPLALSKTALADAIEQNLDFSFSMEKILVKNPNASAPPPEQQPEGGGSPLGIDPAAFGGLPPELLQALAAGLPPGLPPGMVQGGAGPMPMGPGPADLLAAGVGPPPGGNPLAFPPALG